MTCGDAEVQWADPLLGSVWTGSIDGENLVLHLNPVQNVALTTVGLIAGVGPWTVDYDMRWTAALEGFVWRFEISLGNAVCSSGKVSSASGGAIDPNGVVKSFTLTRVL